MQRQFRTILLVALGMHWGVGSAWAQRDLTDIPEPNPTAELAAMRIDPAVTVNLFASDPQIRKPIQSNFDSTGRLWVASSEAYPQLAPGQIANDKIIVLEDADRDGVAENSTVFIDGLLMPTGICPDGPHAAYVAHATELLYLEDTDHDGKADRRQVVLSGFGTEDTHHLIHTLRWGPDGCLYFNQSIYIHTTVETAFGVKRLDGGGIWRYRPETGELEIVCKGFVNPWGHVFDAYGTSLATDGAYFEGINHVFPDAVFVTSPGATRWLKGMNPGSPKHCGLVVLSGPHVPEEYQGDLVTNDFRGHRVCRFTIGRAGSTFESRQQPEVITTEHVAFRPIDATMGGDGALYIADWYNPIIQHGEVDFRDERRDREHGRIWRVTFNGRDLDEVPAYAELSTDELVSLLEDSSLGVRQFARLELKGRDAKEVRSATGSWVEGATSPEQTEHRVLEAMWINECLDIVDAERLEQAFTATNPRIRAAAVRVIGSRRAELPAADQWLASAVADPDGLVRLEAVAALGRGSSAHDIEVALRVLDQAPLDDHLDFALWTAVRNLAPQWTGKLAAGEFDFGGKTERLVFLLSAAGSPEAAEPVVAAVTGKNDALKLGADDAASLVGPLAGIGSPDQVARLVEAVFGERNWNAENQARLLEAVVSQSQRRGNVPPGVEPTIVGHYGADVTSELRGALVRAAAAWKVVGMVKPLVTAVTDDNLQNTPVQMKSGMIDALGQIASPDAVRALRVFTTDQSMTAGLRADAAVALIGPARPQAVEAIEQLLQEDATRGSMIDRAAAVLQRNGMADPLTAVVNKIKLPADDARRMISVTRNANAPDSLIAAIQQAGSLSEAGWKWSEELSNEILKLAAEQGDPVRGEAIYRQEKLQCIKCHAIGDGGGLVGPNLVSIGGASPPEYILRSLIEPNDKLKEGFSTLQVLTVDGRVVQGIPAGRDNETLQLRTAEGRIESIALSDIEEESNGQSLMPAGLIDALSRQELADLTRFLTEVGRTPQYTVSTKQLVRSAESLVYSNEVNHVLNRNSNDSVTSDDPIFVWKPLVSRVDGVLPITEVDAYQQHREVPPSGYIRFKITTGESGKSRLKFAPDEGVLMWIDGRPAPVFHAVELTLEPGEHQVILGVNKNIVKDGVTVEIVE